MTSERPSFSMRRLGRAGRTQWKELGGLGRVALVGVLMSGAVAVVLGFTIPAIVENHLRDERAGTISRVVDDFVMSELVPQGSSDPRALQPLDDAVHRNLLGGDTVRVKVWSPDGTIVYSDAPEAIGRSYALDTDTAAAFRGSVVVESTDLSEPENVTEHGLGSLIEFYVPARGADGEVFGVFEVYQRAEPLQATVGQIRLTVWLSIGIGLGVLGLFMGTLTLAIARVITRRRRQAEDLLGALLRAQDEERTRIVGALHDDVGQPMYRLLYGIQSSRVKLPPDHPVGAELARMEDLVRGMDGSLRSELKTLHHSDVADLGLGPALRLLVEAIRRETDLELHLDVTTDVDLELVGGSALHRAAQEAITNVRKHAAATSVDIRLTDKGGRVILDVVDDGTGVTAPPGLGLATTRERLESVGGGLSVTRSRGGGTHFRAWVPADIGSGR